MKYDYIIIGAGSAGCVLANRLSADPKISVLLLEAGQPDHKLEIKIPIAFSQLFQTDFDWCYYTEPQPQLEYRRIYWPRGKALGGSSSINAMIYIRGHQADYDHWAQQGNPGWSFAEVLPAFKQGEHQERGASEYHSIGGELNIADPRSPHPLCQTFIEAAHQLGLPSLPDLNIPNPLGVSIYQLTQKNGERHSAARAYLHPCLSRPNLKVLTQTQVTRLILQDTRVIGIEFVQAGQIQQIQAKQEIILSGGAINSPQLLMLSGIGPANHLETLNIPVVVNLPGVGQNLQDHIASPVIYQCTHPQRLLPANTPRNWLKYVLWRRGTLTSNLAEAGGFIQTNPDLPSADLQIFFAPICFYNHGFTRFPGYQFSIGATVLRPHSRGWIRLQSSDPLQAPLIQPNYLSHPDDWQLMLKALEISRQVAQASPFDPWRGWEVVPGEAVQTEAQLRGYIAQTAQTLYHPAGTCAMGNDAMAVVNHHLQVRGVQGLRVVDASIMPTIVSGNPNAVVLMIAEKAAQWILNHRY